MKPGDAAGSEVAGSEVAGSEVAGNEIARTGAARTDAAADAAAREARARAQERRRLRSFGLTVGAAFVILAGFLLWKERAPYPYFGGAGILLILSGLLVPWVLRPIERVWMIVALAMGYVMTRVILGLVFLLVFAPAGLVIRLLRKDPMELRFDSQASSYWHEREEKIDPERMERMF